MRLAIVGGGITGVATAYYLAKAGVDCVLIEKDQIARHASGFALGGLHPRVTVEAPKKMKEFTLRSFDQHVALYRELVDLVDGYSNWRTRRSLQLTWNESEANLLKQDAARQDTHAEWHDVNSLLQEEIRLAPDVLGGIVSDKSAELDANVLTQTLFAQSHCQFIVGEISSVKLNHEKVVAVNLQGQAPIEADAFVFALGPWSNRVFEWLGSPARPIKPLKGQILRFRLDGKPLNHTYSVSSNYLTSKADGLLWVGTTEEDEDFCASPTDYGRKVIGGIARQVLPEAEMAVVHHTACIRPMSIDNGVILGQLEPMSNAYIASGGGRKGILYGPLLAFEIANLFTSGSFMHDWQDLSPSRFDSKLN